MTLGIEYTWYRRLSDGRVEFEFDPETGEERLWGETPTNITEVGWIPMNPDLAQKMAVHGNTGVPITSLVMAIKVKPGEEPIVFRDRELRRGAHVTCKICNKSFLSTEPPKACVFCEAEPEEGKNSPFILQQAEWEQAVYEIGVKGRFVQRFNSQVSVSQ